MPAVCWSDYSYLCSRSNGCSSQSDDTGATITNPLTTAASVSGLAPNISDGGIVHLYASSGADGDGAPIITGYIGNSIVSSGVWTVNVPSGTVGDYACSDLSAYFYESGSCLSLPIFGTVIGAVASDIPTVIGPYCDPVTSIYGTSTEEKGTFIDVLVGGLSVGTTTVDQFGTWALGGLNILSGSITATAQNTSNCETASLESAPVIINATPSAPAITWPAIVDEGATSITVTGGTGTQILYIDGTPVTDSGENPFTSSTGTFSGLSDPGIPESYIYAGGLLSIVETDGTCLSPESNKKEVACTNPDESLTVSPTSITISSGATVDVTIAGTESFVFYQLYNSGLSANSGIAGMGNLGGLTLTSEPLTANTIIQVVATKIFPTGCSTVLTNETDVTISVVTPTIAFSTTNSSGLESVATADLQVDLSVVSGLDVTVDYTVSGTATGGGIDYTLANGTLTILAGYGNNNITIASIMEDLLDENNETVIVTLSNPTNATLGVNTVYTYTITDNDSSPIISVTDESIPEGTTTVETATATDGDAGDTQTFSIAGTDAALFDIDPSTGELTFKAAPDFENPLDDGTDNIYDLDVTVTDAGGNSDTQSIQVTVTGINDNNPVLSAMAGTIPEGTTT